MNLSDEDRAGLSPAEIAAVEAADDDDKQAEQGEPAAETKPAQAETKPADQAESEGKPADTSAATPDEDEAKPGPGVATPDVEGYDEKLKTLRAHKHAAFKDLMEGKVTAEDYSATEDKIGEQIADIVHQRKEHQAEARRAQQSAQAEWQWECKRFMREVAKSEGLDYTSDAALGKELDAQVRTLAADPDNASRSGEWFLEQAHRRVKAIHAVAGKPSAPAPAPVAAPSRKPDLSGVAPTLARVPAAMTATVADDEFAPLRSLSGDKYERAIAAMTPEQLDRFMG